MNKSTLVIGAIALLAALGSTAAYYGGVPYISDNVSKLITYANVPYNGFSPVYAAFVNDTILSAVYLPVNDPKNFSCSPTTAQLFPNATAAAGVTKCEIGVKGDTTGADPEWIAVPAFAGESVFGPKMGGDSNGFPIFQNRTILTNCGGGYPTPGMCMDHPNFFYSPYFTKVEQLMNITNGTDGLPEGVLPGPAHNHFMINDENGQFVGWYLINVLVFDPNIFPNPQTGKCAQIANSSLKDPTGNCLLSLGAFANAITTNDSAIAAINANNPLWIAAGRPMTEIVIPNDTVSTLNQSNSNVDINFSIEYVNPYTGTKVPDIEAPATGGTASQPQQSASPNMLYIIGAAVVAVVIIYVLMRMRSGKKGNGIPQGTAQGQTAA
ncbi:MAG: hypothetical protein KGH98_04290 [Candidatus Micrarchaeota archaeon]|nr:hypothetical protein [Candidatus Micrarchaeota archaeon]